MVRDSRIKEQKFAPTFVSGAGSVCYDPNGKETINGEILEVEWNTNITGSLFMTFGRSAEEFWRRNAPSGTTAGVARPYVFSQVSTGSIAGAYPIPYVTNDVVWLNWAGAGSVAQLTTAWIRYR